MNAKDVILARKLGGGGGGTEITDGIVVNSVDSAGFATEVTVYGPNLSRGALYYAERTFAGRLTIINGLESLINVGMNGFKSSLINHDMILPNLVTAGESAFSEIKTASNLKFHAPNLTKLGVWAFVRSSAFGEIHLPKVTNFERETFAGANRFYDVILGSVGFGVTSLPNSCFNQCTQLGATITAYTNGSYADTLLSNIRNGATNATIIIKAAEDTTYNDVSYAAGETMITSTVEEAT